MVAVFITLALIGNPTGSNYEYLTNGTLNETEMIRTGAFAHLASNRDAIGVDKLGQVKKKWQAPSQSTINHLF